jgi:hypothetical protein
MTSFELPELLKAAFPMFIHSSLLVACDSPGKGLWFGSAFSVTMRGLLKVLELVVTVANYLFQNGLNPK